MFAQSMKNRIGILIPVFNAADSIAQVLEGFSISVLSQIDEILVIDNKSTDQTIQKIEAVRQRSPLLAERMTVIRNPQNEGYGGSQKIGYSYFIERDKTHIMVIHGDNQGNSEKIARRFLAALEEDPNVDLVVASRFTSQSSLQGYNPLRVWGNHFFNVLTRWISGLKMSDAGTAIILVRTQALKACPFHQFSQQFHFPPQLNLWFYSNLGLRIHEVELVWKDSESGSQLNLFRYGCGLFRFLMWYAWETRVRHRRVEDMFGSPNQAFAAR